MQTFAIKFPGLLDPVIVQVWSTYRVGKQWFDPVNPIEIDLDSWSSYFERRNIIEKLLLILFANTHYLLNTLLSTHSEPCRSVKMLPWPYPILQLTHLLIIFPCVFSFSFTLSATPVDASLLYYQIDAETARQRWPLNPWLHNLRQFGYAPEDMPNNPNPITIFKWLP